ncbi:hypothetical protein C8K36_109156 [Rhodococcus sp. OK519]|uniref:ABC transporter permease n=1 Tax=Rhodococcus sp. OK519 TaxID=2135729 RepID=UPI000D3930F3|nr:hypothetical protein C8K36_109156 [Rhodococcus sp. OK519]
MNALETTDPLLRQENRAQIDTKDHVRAEREARSIAEEARIQERRRTRSLSTVFAVLAAVGPTVMALTIGVPPGEAFRVLLLTVVPAACAYFMLRSR